MSGFRAAGLAGLLAAALLSEGCGYHVAGKADMVPKSVKTIAIPAFGNVSTRYRLASALPKYITREFITRTRYEVVTDEKNADAILRGSVIRYDSYPIVFDPVSGRASAVQLGVVLQVNLVERKTGKVLFTRPYMEVRDRYEIAVDQNAFFEESDAALDRLSQDVAKTLVSAILENF